MISHSSCWPRLFELLVFFLPQVLGLQVLAITPEAQIVLKNYLTFS